MIDHVLHLRTTVNKDWVALLFLLSFFLITITKSAFENRFINFINLIYPEKYSNTHREGNYLVSIFTFMLYVIQLLSITFFIQIYLDYLGYISKTDWVLFLKFFTFLNFFILSKLLIEKIISEAFNIDFFLEEFHYKKITYRTYISLILLPIDFLMFYYDLIQQKAIIVIMFLILTSNVLIYLIIINKNKKLILSKLFYFILYLCTLEIAPYYFIYYYFTKGIFLSNISL